MTKIQKVVNTPYFSRPPKWTWSGARFVRNKAGEVEFENQKLPLRYKRARIYSAQFGRFISRDPLGYVDGLSLYRAYFVPGRVDPFGLNVEKTGNVDKTSWPYSPIYGVGGNGWFGSWDFCFIKVYEGPFWNRRYVYSKIVPCPRCPNPRIGLATPPPALVGVLCRRPSTVDVFPPIQLDPKCEEDEPWGNVCCVYMHKLADTIDRLDTVCHYSIQSPIRECCDETRPGFDLVDVYAGLCGPDDWD